MNSSFEEPFCQRSDQAELRFWRQNRLFGGCASSTMHVRVRARNFVIRVLLHGTRAYRAGRTDGRVPDGGETIMADAQHRHRPARVPATSALLPRHFASGLSPVEANRYAKSNLFECLRFVEWHFHAVAAAPPATFLLSSRCSLLPAYSALHSCGMRLWY
jgi:hypothetical protein